MKKLFFIIACLCLLIATSAVAYYLISVLPQKNKIQQSLAMKEKCSQAGEKAYELDKKSQAENYPSDEVIMHDPQFSFNSDLNTCLYYGGYNVYMSGIPGFTGSEYVVDVFTNNHVLDLPFYSNKYPISKEFLDKVKKLMASN